MWAWIGPFLAASLAAHGGGSYAGLNASAATFLVIAIGALGCWIGNRVSDRWGRTALTMISMAASGICALAIGFTFDRPARGEPARRGGSARSPRGDPGRDPRSHRARHLLVTRVLADGPYFISP